MSGKISVLCPYCRKPITVSSETRGTIKCPYPGCGRSIELSDHSRLFATIATHKELIAWKLWRATITGNVVRAVPPMLLGSAALIALAAAIVGQRVPDMLAGALVDLDRLAEQGVTSSGWRVLCLIVAGFSVLGLLMSRVRGWFTERVDRGNEVNAALQNALVELETLNHVGTVAEDYKRLNERYRDWVPRSWK